MLIRKISTITPSSLLAPVMYVKIQKLFRQDFCIVSRKRNYNFWCTNFQISFCFILGSEGIIMKLSFQTKQEQSHLFWNYFFLWLFTTRHQSFYVAKNQGSHTKGVGCWKHIVYLIDCDIIRRISVDLLLTFKVTYLPIYLLPIVSLKRGANMRGRMIRKLPRKES